jgi:hypothetical protein
MGEINRERIERLKSRVPLVGRKRTSSLRNVAKQFMEQSRGLTAKRTREVDRTADGEAFREAYKGASRRKV